MVLRLKQPMKRSCRFVRVTAASAVPKGKLVAFIRQAARFADQDQEHEEEVAA